MPMFHRALLLALTLGIAALPARGEPAVVASIKPVHSLVASVMAGIGEPALIVSGAASPHAYSLRPSDAARMERADVVYWIGHELETFLEGPIAAIAPKARSIELIETRSLRTLDLREGGAFEGAEDDHDHEGRDAHVWLDPVNAGILVRRIGEVLSEFDPGNAGRYRANAEDAAARLQALDAETAARLEPVRDRPFIVFHDAFQYFESRYGLAAAGAITVNPEVTPGVERIREIRRRIGETGVACVFSEPQFDPKTIAVVTEGMDVRSAVLDPLGAAIADGPALYFELIRGMAGQFVDCLSAGG